jgi:hypothetical protein
MKTRKGLLILLSIHLLTASWQCDKCIERPDALLTSARSWLPLKGKTELIFADETGMQKPFALFVTDTIEIHSSCPSSFQYEYIGGQLFLNNNKSDYISFNLQPPHLLIVNAISNTLTQISVRDVLTKAGTIAEARKFSNYTIGSRTYPEVILLKATAASATIDSIFIANNTGIAGFKYNGIRYNIQ